MGPLPSPKRSPRLEDDRRTDLIERWAGWIGAAALVPSAALAGAIAAGAEGAWVLVVATTIPLGAIALLVVVATLRTRAAVRRRDAARLADRATMVEHRLAEVLEQAHEVQAELRSVAAEVGVLRAEVESEVWGRLRRELTEELSSRLDGGGLEEYRGGFGIAGPVDTPEGQAVVVVLAGLEGPELRDEAPVDDLRPVEIEGSAPSDAVRFSVQVEIERGRDDGTDRVDLRRFPLYADPVWGTSVTVGLPRSTAVHAVHATLFQRGRIVQVAHLDLGWS